MINTVLSIASFLMAAGGTAIAVNNHIDNRQDKTDKAIAVLDGRLEVLTTALLERSKLVDYRLAQLETGTSKAKYQRT